jgi:hypothetical protein
MWRYRTPTTLSEAMNSPISIPKEPTTMRHDDTDLDALHEPLCECRHSLFSHALTGGHARGRCLAPRRNQQGCGCPAYRAVTVAARIDSDETAEVPDAQTR